MTPALWTLDELAGKVAEAVAAAGVGQASGRVTELPPPRTIRFYTTLGILDPAAELRGRPAYYGRRHLLQLVAIKRLQSEGESLAAVQKRLAGLSSAELARLAQLPDAPEPGRARRKDFWKEAPPAPASPAASLVSVPVEGLMLVFPAAQALTEDDLAALRAAAAPLLAVIRKRQLYPPKDGPDEP